MLFFLTILANTALCFLEELRTAVERANDVQIVLSPPYRAEVIRTLTEAMTIHNSAQRKPEPEKTMDELSAVALAIRPGHEETSNFMYDKLKDRLVSKSEDILNAGTRLANMRTDGNRLTAFAERYPVLHKKLTQPTQQVLNIAYLHKSPDLGAIIIGRLVDIEDLNSWMNAFDFAESPWETFWDDAPQESRKAQYHVNVRISTVILQQAYERNCEGVSMADLLDGAASVCSLLDGFKMIAKHWSRVETIHTNWLTTFRLAR